MWLFGADISRLFDVMAEIRHFCQEYMCHSEHVPQKHFTRFKMDVDCQEPNFCVATVSE